MYEEGRIRSGFQRFPSISRVVPYFQILGRHEFGRIGGVAKGRGDVESGGDIGGAINVVVAMNSERRLVLRFSS